MRAELLVILNGSDVHPGRENASSARAFSPVQILASDRISLFNRECKQLVSHRWHVPYVGVDPAHL